MGYSFQLAIDYSGPDNPPEGAGPLLGELAANKGTAIHWLAERKAAAWTVVPTSEGDAYEITFDGVDEGQLKRHALAVQAGLIALDGPVRFHRKDNAVRVAFRCAMPLEWLERDITAEAKRHLGRIHRGEAWLLSHSDDPRYDAHYARFTALFDDLRELYNAVGEVLEDPFVGYQEAAA